MSPEHTSSPCSSANAAIMASGTTFALTSTFMPSS